METASLGELELLPPFCTESCFALWCSRLALSGREKQWLVASARATWVAAEKYLQPRVGEWLILCCRCDNCLVWELNCGSDGPVWHLPLPLSSFSFFPKSETAFIFSKTETKFIA